MNWLLKITDGPMKGAEIALAGGTRVTFGKSDTCDIVIADATLAETAFSLDVSDAGVTLVRTDGSGLAMKPFETHAFGTTAVAVGPAEGAWEDLRPAPVEEPPAEPTAEAPTAAEPAAEPSAPAEPAAPAAEAPDAEKPKRRRVWPVVVVVFLVLLLALAAAAFFGWTRREALRERFPSAVARAEALFDRCRAMCGEGTRAVAAQAPSVEGALRKLAAEHGLSFVSTNGLPLLSGNLKRRTERHAIRALALAADRFCRLDLSDDESFASAADALLFMLTEGAVKPAKAESRKLALTGYAPDAVALVRVLEALHDDVPWLAEVDRAGVTVGGPVPVGLLGNRFAETGQFAMRPATSAGMPAGADAENAAAPDAPAATNAVAEVVEKPKAPAADAAGAAADKASPAIAADVPPDEREAAALAQQAALADGRLPREVLPVAGILTKPYPCVVLSDGHRLVEGAKIAGLEITAIEPARIVFVYRDQTLRWEP